MISMSHWVKDLPFCVDHKFNWVDAALMVIPHQSISPMVITDRSCFRFLLAEDVNSKKQLRISPFIYDLLSVSPGIYAQMKVTFKAYAHINCNDSPHFGCFETAYGSCLPGTEKDGMHQVQTGKMEKAEISIVVDGIEDSASPPMETVNEWQAVWALYADGGGN